MAAIEKGTSDVVNNSTDSESSHQTNSLPGLKTSKLRLQASDVHNIFKCLRENTIPPRDVPFTILPVDQAAGLTIAPPSFEYPGKHQYSRISVLNSTMTNFFLSFHFSRRFLFFSKVGLYVLWRPNQKRKFDKLSMEDGTLTAPSQLEDVVMDPIPFSTGCPWYLLRPHHFLSTDFRQHWCYPLGKGRYSWKTRGVLWTAFNEDGQEDLEFRLLHVHDYRPRTSEPEETVFLVYAASEGNIDEVRQLLEGGIADPGAQANYPIRIASAKGYTDIVRLLLRDERVDPSACQGEAVKRAIHNGHREVIKLLLQDRRVYKHRIRLGGFADLVNMIEKDELSSTVDAGTLMEACHSGTGLCDKIFGALATRHNAVVIQVATLARSHSFQSLPFEVQCAIVFDHFSYALFPCKREKNWHGITCISYQKNEDKQKQIARMMQRFIG